MPGHGPGQMWLPSGLAVDAQDRVYVFDRGEHPMIVFEPDGTFVTAWEKGLFTRPHGVTVGPDGALYCVDTAFASAVRMANCWAVVRSSVGIFEAVTFFIPIPNKDYGPILEPEFVITRNPGFEDMRTY